MNRISVNDLKVDSYFDAPVFLDEEFLVLSPEVPVTRELVNRLKRWGYAEVLTDGRSSDAPAQGLAIEEPGMLASLDETQQEKEARLKVSAFYLQLLAYTEEMLKAAVESGHLNNAVLSDRVRGAVDVVRENRDPVLAAVAVDRAVESYLVTQSVSVALLSVAVGDFMKLPVHRLIELGTAALLHRVGMARLPAAVYLSDHALSAAEQKSVFAYPILGYRMLKTFSVNENIALGVLEHQERADGSGYPRKLQGEAVSLYARIIGAVGSYMAMVSRRPWRGARDGHAAIMDLLKTNRKAYDEKVIMALVYTLSLFPVGTHVMLSNDVRGIVYKTNPEDPRCPVVRTLMDRDGNPIPDSPLIRTGKERDLNVVRALTAQEASEL